MKARLLLAATAVAVGATTCSVAPSHADDARDGFSRVEVRNDVMNVRCEGTPTTQDCNLRVPAGYSYLRLKFVHGGQGYAIEETWTYEKRSTAGGVRRFDERVGDGVRLRCTAAGNRLFCTIEFRARVRNWDVTQYSAGNMWGGLVVEGAGVAPGSVEVVQ